MKIPFFKHFSKKELEQKSTPTIVDYFKHIGLYGSDSSWHQLTPRESFTFYQQVSAVKNAIDIIVDEFCSIVPRVWDTKTKEWVDNHPITELLKQPNAFENGSTVLRSYVINYLVTGNSFLVQTGELTKPPMEIYNKSPMDVIIHRANDGYPLNYQLSNINGSIVFDRVNTSTISREVSDRLGEFRFIDSTMAREISQVKTFNPSINSNSGMFFGLSPLSAIFYEIKQFIESNVHNWSLLKRGGRPSGALSVEDELTDDQFQRLQAEINNAIAGSENSGRPLLLEKGMQWIELAVNNKDMDFEGLKKILIQAIYNQYKVPLPLILPDTMTLANYDSAKISLYDNAVLPLTKYLYATLTQFVLKRYPDSEDLILAYDPHDIPALEMKRITSVKEMAQIGVLTTNELRTKLGYEMIEGGDEILAPANLLPSMRDQVTDDNLVKPRPKTPRKSFMDLVSQNMDKTDKNVSFDELNTIIKENGLGY